MNFFKGSSSEVIVSPKKQGSLRENALYHFMMDYMHSPLLSSFDIRVGQGSRKVIYVKIPVMNAAESAFIAGFTLVEQHLSIDKLIDHKEFSWLTTGSPAHRTWELVNQDATECLVVHDYLNLNGRITGASAKSYPLRNGERVTEEGLPRAISHEEQARFHQASFPFQALFTQLLEHKSTVYIELYDDSFKLDNALSQSISEKNGPQAIEQINALITLTERLTRYNDTQIDGRITHLKRILGQLTDGALLQDDEKDRGLSAAAMVEDNPTPQKPVHPSHPGKQSPPKSNKQDDAKREITALVHQISSWCAKNTKLSIAQTLIEMATAFQQLDTTILALECSALGTNVTTFIAKQREQLPIKTSLDAYFNARVLAGDLEAVVTLYPMLVQRTNMFSVITRLLIAIRNECDSERCKQLIEIADFFYEESELYRSLLRLHNQFLNYDASNQIGHGFLLGLFETNNFMGFCMALRHGVPTDSIQMMYGTTSLNALRSLIICYQHNPNVCFIQELIKNGAEMDMPMGQTMAIAPTGAKPFFKSTTADSLSFVLKEPSNRDLSALIKRYNKTSNALKLASDIWGETYPELIIALANHAEPLHLFASASHLFNINLFRTRFIPFSLALNAYTYVNKTACDEAMRASKPSSSGDTSPCYLFYCSFAGALPTARETALYTSARHLLGKCRDAYAFKDLDVHQRRLQQRRIIKQLTTVATEAKELKNYIGAICHYKAAQIAYTMMNQPQSLDHEVMAQLFAFMITVVKKVSTDSLPGIYLDAHNFIAHLPPEELALLLEKPIYKNFLKDKIEALAHENVHFHSKLMVFNG